MTPVADSAVRWHPAPAATLPQPQAMVDPPPASGQQRPNLTELRQSLAAARREAESLQERRTQAHEAIQRQARAGYSAEACCGAGLVGVGYLVTAAMCPMPLGWRLITYLIGAGFTAGGFGTAGCCLVCRRTDQRLVADDPPDAALTAGVQRLAAVEPVVADAEFSEAVITSVEATLGPDIGRLIVGYAEPRPRGDDAVAPPR